MLMSIPALPQLPPALALRFWVVVHSSQTDRLLFAVEGMDLSKDERALLRSWLYVQSYAHRHGTWRDYLEAQLLRLLQEEAHP